MGLASAALLLTVVLAPPHGLAHKEVAAWTWFHYYLGSKYFAELGYFTIYEQTVASERDRGGPLANPDVIRDLHTYERVGPEVLDTIERSPAWTDARWAEFQADLDSLRPELSTIYWFDVLRDRGYNATPAWNTVAGWLTNALSVQSGAHRRLLKAVDVAGLAAVLWVFLRVFGGVRTGLFLLAFWLFPATGGRFLGTLIQYDWFAVLCLAAAAAATGRRGWLGFLLGIATAMRVFPVVFLGGALAWTTLQLVDHRRLPAGTLRLAGGFLAALVLAGVLGSIGPRGLDAWPEFADKIHVHNQHHRFGNARVGLAHALTGRGLGHAVPKEESRPGNLQRRTPERIAVGAVLVLLLGMALRRRDELDATLLMLVAFFVLSVASRYYWTLLSLFVLLGVGEGRPRWKLVLGSALALLPSVLWYAHAPMHRSSWSDWVFFNQALTVLFAGALMALIGSDVRASGGWRGWLRPFPSPGAAEASEVKESQGERGGVHVYAAQAKPTLDAEIGRIGSPWAGN